MYISGLVINKVAIKPVFIRIRMVFNLSTAMLIYII